MQTLEAIAKRKSTRDFDPNRAVPDDVVDTIVKAGCQAPIGGNQRDSLHLTVCRSREILDEINQSTAATMNIEARDFFYGAPAAIFVSAAPKQMAPSVEYANAGLCAKMGIPEGFRPVSAAAIGYSQSGEAQPRELSVSLSVNYI
ncbi:MAG: nitroreductase family protein [Oscillospiraceae bacterium]|nr:nitroreductase family protein [Oscillospiraceae bacterium]